MPIFPLFDVPKPKKVLFNFVAKQILTSASPLEPPIVLPVAVFARTSSGSVFEVHNLAVCGVVFASILPFFILHSTLRHSLSRRLFLNLWPQSTLTYRLDRRRRFDGAQFLVLSPLQSIHLQQRRGHGKVITLKPMPFYVHRNFTILYSITAISVFLVSLLDFPVSSYLNTL